jgi:penicillin amidase
VRKLFRLFAFLLVLAAAIVLLGYVYLRQSLPPLEGEIPVAGINAAVEILRDAYGVPHIFAASERDAQFALGFVHAQDRLWQLEMNRRIGAGRLSEVLGRGGLETDRFMRTLGLRRAAQANHAHLDGDTRATLDAYAAGVNALLATRPVLPPEFLLLRVRPEPWSAADSISWLKVMAWDLGGNWRNELLRMRLARTMDLARIHQFLPPYPGDAVPEIRELKDVYEGLEREPPRIASVESGSDPAFLKLGSDPDSAVGSNSWVLAGARSASGKPLLANDPHLGLTAPPQWYLAHLSAPGLEVIGATLPGVPGVLVGRNARIAWGFTNTGPDVQDLYLEKLDTAGNYLTPQGARPFEVIAETIGVKGAAEEALQVRVSRHGPIISDVVRSALELTPRGHAMAFAWTALAQDDRTMQAAIRIGRAQTWQEFEAALRDLHAPQQTVTYADVEGNIGFVAAGRVPVRKPENDLKGLAPAPGWDARYDWTGYLPFDALPRGFNPAGGTIVSANQKITPAGYPHHITFEWQAPYRARRAEELLLAAHKPSVATLARMQMDVVSLAVRELLPHLLSTRPKDAAGREALKMLAAWDGGMAADRAEPLIVTAWWRELAFVLYADELGGDFRPNWSARAPFVQGVLKGHGAWCDDVRTPRVETCEEILSESLDRALRDLRRRFGEDPKSWQWGAAHPAQHRHRPFSRSAVLAPLFEIAVASPGDAYSINVGRSDFGDDAAPYASRHGAGYRAIYDLADPQASLYIHSGGQSGNPLSAHYRSFAEPWARGEYIRMVTDRKQLEANGARRLVLTPRK